MLHLHIPVPTAESQVHPHVPLLILLISLCILHSFLQEEKVCETNHDFYYIPILSSTRKSVLRTVNQQIGTLRYRKCTSRGMAAGTSNG
jgi:hypothetical protein